MNILAQIVYENKIKKRGRDVLSSIQTNVKSNKSYKRIKTQEERGNTSCFG
jgi:hypothetical protein